jgi:hypothetical protein
MSIPHSKLAKLCSFAFVDGRHCRTPRFAGHPRYCWFHAKKDAERRATEEIGYDIGCWLTGDYVSACDLTHALGRVFSNVAQGKIKPRTAATLAYLGQTIAFLIPRAQNEFVQARGVQAWINEIRNSSEQNPDSPSIRPPGSDEDASNADTRAQLDPEPQPELLPAATA